MVMTMVMMIMIIHNCDNYHGRGRDDDNRGAVQFSLNVDDTRSAFVKIVHFRRKPLHPHVNNSKSMKIIVFSGFLGTKPLR